jgi:hypothetical protein
MSRRSIVVPLTACVLFGVLLGSGRSVRAHVMTQNPSVQTGSERCGGDNRDPLVSASASNRHRTTKFSCQVGVRSSRERDLQKFQPNLARRQFRKSSQGLEVEATS